MNPTHELCKSKPCVFVEGDYWYGFGCKLRFGSCSPGSCLTRPLDRNKKYELTLVELSFVNNKYNINAYATLIFNVIFVSYRVCRHQCTQKWSTQKWSQGGGAFNSKDVCAAAKQDLNFVNNLDAVYCTTNNPNILQCVVWQSWCKQSLLSSMPFCQLGCVHGNTSLNFVLETMPALILSAQVDTSAQLPPCVSVDSSHYLLPHQPWTTSNVSHPSHSCKQTTYHTPRFLFKFAHLLLCSLLKAVWRGLKRPIRLLVIKMSSSLCPIKATN